MSGPETLDSLLYECTKSNNQALDADLVEKFCKAVENDLDGPSTAARLLGHKIQSPQQQESLNALCVTDECVKKCGRRFQDEVGKFRFLNEIIKMISPKYFGDKTAPKVKTKCIELLYKWSVELRHEPKIMDAYEMLKKQGIIDDDPILDEIIGELGVEATNGTIGAMAAPGAAASTAADDDHKQSIFDDEDKSKLLARLLRSKHPDDLQAANRLIKNMVKQDEEKQEKISQRYNLLETVKNNVKLLNEMLDCYQMSGGSSTSDKDIIKELYKNIDVERPKLFKLASETEDKDSEGMSQILQVNDDVVQISQRYKQVVEEGAGDTNDKPAAPKSSTLEDDLAGLDLGGSSNSSDLFSSFAEAPISNPPASSKSSILDLFSTPVSTTPAVAPVSMASTSIFNPFPAHSAAPQVTATASSNSSNGLDDFFGFSSPSTSMTAPVQTTNATTTAPSLSDDIGLLSLDSAPAASAGLAAPLMPGNDANSISLFDMAESSEDLFDTGKKSALEDLDFLGQDLLQKNKPAQQVLQAAPKPASVTKPSLNQLKKTNVEQTLQAPAAVVTKPAVPAAVPVQMLTNVHVPLDKVQPGSLPALTVYDKDSVKIVLHFAQNKPREDVNVMVISITSSKNLPLKSVVFQAAVPKSMKVKLQPPSGTELPAYNPILPTSAITQIMLLANPNKEKVKLKYKLAYLVNGSPVSATGDVVNFPL